MLSVTATGAGQPLDLQLYPTDARPQQQQRTSTLNLRPGDAVANLSASALAADGSLTASASRDTVQLILDVTGFFTS